MENDLSQTGIFAGFSLCIINFAEGISEAAIGGAGLGPRSALFCVLKSLKRRARARGKNPLQVYYIFFKCTVDTALRQRLCQKMNLSRLCDSCTVQTGTNFQQHITQNEECFYMTFVKSQFTKVKLNSISHHIPVLYSGKSPISDCMRKQRLIPYTSNEGPVRTQYTVNVCFPFMYFQK